jgi:cytochrome P450
MATTTWVRAYDEVDLSSLDFWSTRAADREKSFAILRERRPLSWQPPMQGGMLDDPEAPGYWAIVRHADIVQVSRSDVFISRKGVMFDNIPEEVLEFSQSFLTMDPPRHTKTRALVSAAFTGRQVRRIEEQIARSAATIVEELIAAGSDVDFVGHCAARLPLRTLSDMVGIPHEAREEVMHAADALVSVGDPAYLDGRPAAAVFFQAQLQLKQVALALAEQRRAEPAEDLMTSLVQAEVDGERLTDEEIAGFFVLLAVAGNDTTRNTISHTLKALTDHPEQREWLTADLDRRLPRAVEEFVRWATPVMTFCRTAATDFELHGRLIAAGDKVGLFYASANWDTEVFSAPDELDLDRHPNLHLSFGGGGVHYCLGSQLAKAQLRALFRELLGRLPGIRAGEPEYLAGHFVHAIRAMPCYF